MEQVFPVGVGFSSLPIDSNYSGRVTNSQTDFKEGVIEKVFQPGNFIVSLGNGLKIKAKGSGSLKKGNKVRIQLPAKQSLGIEESSSQKITKTLSQDGLQMSAMIPLAFGGKRAKARLEVFVERQMAGGREQGIAATYFVFTIETERNGEIQWSIHLKGKQVTLQVFSNLGEGEKERLKELVCEVEGSLKNQGFSLTAPTTFLSRPFQVPSGFRLNVTG